MMSVITRDQLEALVRELAEYKLSLNMAHALNVALLHKLGGQQVLCTEQVRIIGQEFPYIDLAFEPGFMCVKLCSTPPQVTQ